MPLFNAKYLTNGQKYGHSTVANKPKFMACNQLAQYTFQGLVGLKW